MSQQRPGWRQRTRSWWDRQMQRRRVQSAYGQGLRDGDTLAQRRAPSPLGALLLALIFVLLCILLASLLGWQPDSWFATAEPTQIISIASDNLLSGTSSALVGPLPPAQVQLAADRFRPGYDQLGGINVLGYAISPVIPMNIGGRQRDVQWFQRGRLEHWPELAAQGYEYQLGRVGVEYTTDIRFPSPPASAVQPQPYVVSVPERLYFRETQHTISGGFLRFWQANGGLRTLGFPVSEEFNEVLEGRSYRVQYFERARLEWHPDLPPPNDIQAGLLGSALYAAAGYQPVGTRPTAAGTAPTATTVPAGATAINPTSLPIAPTAVVPIAPTSVVPIAPTLPPGYPAQQQAAPTVRTYP